MIKKTGDQVGNLAINVEYDVDEDSFVFEAYSGEPFYEKLIDHDTVVEIQHLVVEDEYQGQGIATKLYALAIKEIKKVFKDAAIFINASPMGNVGLDLQDLIRFYQKAGFKVLKNYGDNALLWLDDTKKLKTISATMVTSSFKLETKVSSDYKTAELYRGIRSTPFDQIDPLYEGEGVFGKGTYYAISTNVAHSYMNDDVYGWLLKYEFKFKNPIVLQSPTDIDLTGSIHGFEEINTEEIKDVVGDEGIDTSDLSRQLDSHDAIYMLGHVDGGPQVLIPPDSNPPHKFKAASLFVRDKTLVEDLQSIFGMEAKKDPNDRYQWFFPSVPLDRMEEAQVALEEFEEFVNGNVTASASSLIKKFKKVAADEDFYEMEFLDHYDGEESNARNWFNHYLEQFLNELNRLQIGTKGIKVWRAINAKSLEDINLDSVGASWSYKEGKAHTWYGGDGETFVLCGELPDKGIDIEVSLRQNLVNPDEYEFRTESADIYITAIQDKSGKVLKKFSPPLKTQTGDAGLFGDWVASSLSDWSGDWIHYSKHPEVKVNPKTFFKDPAGIYLFPKEFKTIGGWTYYPYKFEVKLKPNLKVLDLSTLDRGGIADLIERMRLTDKEREIITEYVAKAEDKRAVDYWWEMLTNTHTSRQGELNKKFRELGYDAIFDDTSSIHNAEVQMLVLNPSGIASYRQVDETPSLFKVLTEVTEAVRAACEPYGSVKVEGPKKNRAGKLESYLICINGDSRTHWQITPRYFGDEKIPREISIYLSYDTAGLRDQMSRGDSVGFLNWKEKWPDAAEEINSVLRKVFSDKKTASTWTATNPSPSDWPYTRGVHPMDAKETLGHWYSFESQLPYNGKHPMDDPNANVGSPTMRNEVAWPSKPLDTDRRLAKRTQAALQFKTQPQEWNGTTTLKQGVAVDSKLYTINGDAIDWIKKHVNVPEPEIAEALETGEIPADFYRVYRPIFIDNLEFTAYDLTDRETFQDVILKVLLKRNPIPKDFLYHTIQPKKSRKVLVQDFLKKGEKVLASDSYTEIEFVCVNPDFKDATAATAQTALYKDLQKLEGVLPYRQDWGDGQLSLAVIILDRTKEKELETKILALAKKHGVELDMYNDADPWKVNEIMDGELDNLVTSEVTVSRFVQSGLKVDYHTVMLNLDDCEPKDGMEAFADCLRMIPKEAIRDFHPIPDGLSLTAWSSTRT
jgi:GNAT superfamily N-acetyltransferase